MTLFIGCGGVEEKSLGGTSSFLEIHHINVAQGDATLIIGPNKTTLLIDAGKPGKGIEKVVPYLKKIGLSPENGLDYMIATHRDADHIGGLDEVIEAGYNVRKNIWDNGSKKTGTQITEFLDAAKKTPSGPVSAMALGTIIDLGEGARATAVAVSGDVYNGGAMPINDGVEEETENDKSVALLIQYREFDYITAGDLGGGETGEDKACTGRTTTQTNIESLLAKSLMPGGGASLLTKSGVEVLHVNHHGGESSTNSEYMNLLTPKVAVIHVGAGQGSTYQHPRKDVVEKVLLGRGSCITASPALVLQTDEGDPVGSNTSREGYVSGDIVIRTTGVDTFVISGSGDAQGPDELAAAGIEPPLSIPLDP